MLIHESGGKSLATKSRLSMIERYCIATCGASGGARSHSDGSVDCSAVRERSLAKKNEPIARPRPLGTNGTKHADTSDHCTSRASSGGGTADGT